MRLATIKWNDTEMAGIVAKNGILPIRALNAAQGHRVEDRYAVPDPGAADPRPDRLV